MKHTHKYKRVIYKKTGWTIFRCVLPDCTHFLPTKDLAPGRISICWQCEEEFVLSQENLAQAKPVCNDCKELRVKYLENLKEIKSAID